MMNAAADQGAWLARFEAALAEPVAADWRGLFTQDCYWRDLLAFTWNIVTLEGAAAIADMAQRQAAPIAAHGFTIDPAIPGAAEGWFDFETATARCKGYVRLDGGRCSCC